LKSGDAEKLKGREIEKLNNEISLFIFFYLSIFSPLCLSASLPVNLK